MTDLRMRKATQAVLANLDGIAVRESILADEVGIRLGVASLDAADFGREMKELMGAKLVKRDWDAFGEALYEITGEGKKAVMGR